MFNDGYFDGISWVLISANSQHYDLKTVLNMLFEDYVEVRKKCVYAALGQNIGLKK